MITLTVTVDTTGNITDLTCALHSIINLIEVDWRTGSFKNATSNAFFSIVGEEPPAKPTDGEF